MLAENHISALNLWMLCSSNVLLVQMLAENHISALNLWMLCSSNVLLVQMLSENHISALNLWMLCFIKCAACANSCRESYLCTESLDALLQQMCCLCKCLQ